MQITNCHTHTFTHDHTPANFAGPVAGFLLRFESADSSSGSCGTSIRSGEAR
jgi:hypothetical protein